MLATKRIIKDRHDSRRHQHSSNKVGHIARPKPPLKHATNPPASTAMVARQFRTGSLPIAGKLRNPTSAPSMNTDALQIHWLEAMIGARAIQKLPTTIPRVDNVCAVAGTAGSRHIGTRSSPIEVENRINPIQKRNSSLP
jgi:hypothetical protein